jgi:hypothetical protein
LALAADFGEGRVEELLRIHLAERGNVDPDALKVILEHGECLPAPMEIAVGAPSLNDYDRLLNEEVVPCPIAVH